MTTRKTQLTRRDFLKTTAVTTAAASFGILHEAHAGNADLIKVGLIGLGERGTAAVGDVIKAAPNVKLTAIAEIFQDRLDAGLKTLLENKQIADGVAVEKDHCFTGFDGYKELLKTDVNMVMICSPIFFHPIHFDAVIEAGKHAFVEKAAAVDAPGCRQIIETGKKAAAKKLNVVAGTQRRHQNTYRDLMKRIQGGEIGNITSGNIYWCAGGESPEYYRAKKAEENDMEYQLRTWYMWRWICGDHIVEQHVHNMDVIMWALGKDPLEARATGSNIHKPHGDCYDNFYVDLVFPDDVHVASFCRQIPKCWRYVGESVMGTKGKCDFKAGKLTADGKEYVSPAEGEKPYVQEHTDLIASIRGEAPYINEAENVAKSTLMAVMGRTAAYTGQVVTWEQTMAMPEKWGPKEFKFGPNPVEEKAPVPPGEIPGVPAKAAK